MKRVGEKIHSFNDDDDAMKITLALCTHMSVHSVVDFEVGGK